MTNAVPGKQQKVRLYTNDKWLIQGELFIRTGSYRGRLSDAVNDPHSFLAISAATVYGADGEIVEDGCFVCVNKSTINLIIEDDL
jgi:hypothetical protein